MNAQRSVIRISLFVSLLSLVVVFASRAQTPRPAGTSAASARQQSTTPAKMDTEREQIWNSPDMLRARAWLHDYCSKSAKVTPELAKHYQTELQNLSAAQMKLWLLKFNHEEEQRQQQHALWQQAHASALSQAQAANAATQRAYASIEQGETEAATQEQQQLNEQTQAAQDLQEAKQLEAVGPYGPYGYGGIHYHYHLYPYPY
jgi:hypothetical protein